MNDPDRLVVGAAIVRAGRVLVARRTAPADVAGRWELPGGKVEPDESPEVALAREIDEELGCTIEVVRWLAGRSPIRPGLVLEIALARLVAGDPEPHEHDEVRWLGPGELDTVDWLDSDRPFLPEVDALLGSSSRGARS